MYLNALINGYQPLQRLPIDKRPEGIENELWEQLQNSDPELAQKTPKQNKARVQRYLELYKFMAKNHRYYLNKHHQTQKTITFMEYQSKKIL